MTQRTDLPRKTRPGPKPAEPPVEVDVEDVRAKMVLEGLKAQKALYMLSITYSVKASEIADNDPDLRAHFTKMAVETYLAAESIRT
jgi:hypothetical protein